jgi:hypothetical protein
MDCHVGTRPTSSSGRVTCSERFAEVISSLEPRDNVVDSDTKVGKQEPG